MAPKQHTTPCDTCPFLKRLGGRFFQRARAEDLVDSFRRDAHFNCHNTVDYSDDSGGRNTKDTRLCVGSVICTEKGGDAPSQMARVSMRLGLLDWGAIRKEAEMNDTVFDNLDAFVEAHDY